MNTFEPDPRLDRDQQRSILELASKLQAEHADSLTRSELEALAVEVGLDTRSVRQATDQVLYGKRQKPQKVSVSGWSLHFVLAVFFAVQVGATLYMAAGRTNMTLMATVLAGLLGLILPENKAGRLFGLGTVFITLAVSSIATWILWNAYPPRALWFDWRTLLVTLGVIEAVAFIVGNSAYSILDVAKSFLSRGDKREPTLGS